MNHKEHIPIGISFDFDSIDSHLRGYGITDAKQCNAHYNKALPRILSLLEKINAKATFFLIAEELIRQPKFAEGIISSGHEIASHSYSHPIPFQTLSTELLDIEIVKSKKILEEISGQKVNGFRAPSWDASPSLLSKLAKAGYHYDASMFPSWLMFIYRWKISKLSEKKNSPAAICSIKQIFGSPKPHQILLDSKRIFEIPITTTPVFGIPFYHTMRFILPSYIFNLVYTLASNRDYPIHYVFHASDFLGLVEDNLDPRIVRHPGMRYCLEDKLLIAERILNKLGSKRKLVSLETISNHI